MPQTNIFPSLDLLDNKPSQPQNISQDEFIETSRQIEKQLSYLGVKATVTDVVVGSVVTRYELELDPSVKVSTVTRMDTDLARALRLKSLRIAEIPGKSSIGIEIPNEYRQFVSLREMLETPEFKQSESLLSIVLGKDVGGKPIVIDLVKCPHLLVAGSPGTGKSVWINSAILGLLYRNKPEDVKFIIIDPKVIEFSVYNNLPHLLSEVVTDVKKAKNALRWCVDEMERRYHLLAELRVRNIKDYNERIEQNQSTEQSDQPSLEKLSYIVVVVDELADLLIQEGKQIEELIARLAQKARAVGIHLIVSTQRASVDIITGLIKANIPSRISFTLTSNIDSRTILDQRGAEALLGRGDMLYSGQGSSDLIRVQGAYVSDDEVKRVVDDWKSRGKPNYVDSILNRPADEDQNNGNSCGDVLDVLFNEAVEYVLSTGVTSVSLLQRKLRVGFNRAARIMDQMEEQGIVSPLQNGKREILARRPNDY